VTLYMKLAWRNMFRNTRRTLIAGLAIGIGLAALIFTDALIIGMEQNMVHSATGSFMGEGQIHEGTLREAFEIEKTINNLDRVTAGLAGEDIIENYTVRTISFAMITSPANVSAVSMFGIDPATEPALSQIDETLIEGSYLPAEPGHEVLIGSKLADILEVGLGDRVVLTVAQAESGDLSQEMFRVTGIYHFNISELDRAMAFVHIDQARRMLALEGRAHEIALKFTDIKLARNKNLPFWSKYSQDGNEAAGWNIILPQLDAAFQLSQFSTLILAVILFGVISLGIVNTLFMSLHERMFEFGVLRAVGTRPMSMGRIIIYEAGSLAVLSVIMGMILGYLSTAIMAGIGIDYTGIEFAGATFRELLYPVPALYQYIKYPLWVLFFTMIIALYPARYAYKMQPAQAMRKSF